MHTVACQQPDAYARHMLLHKLQHLLLGLLQRDFALADALQQQLGRLAGEELQHIVTVP